jgi:hypothetical protein
MGTDILHLMPTSITSLMGLQNSQPGSMENPTRARTPPSKVGIEKKVHRVDLTYRGTRYFLLSCLFGLSPTARRLSEAEEEEFADATERGSQA